MTKAGERLMAAAKEMRGMTTTPDDVMRVARAILKARFYDCEPEMYGSVEEFFASMFSEHVDEAVQEARAAIEAMRPAIMAERERCATRLFVGDAYMEAVSGDGDPYVKVQFRTMEEVVDFYRALVDLAAAIRKAD